MKKLLLSLAAALLAISAFAQGGNTGDGGPDGDFASLSERLLNLEKKGDGFNLFLNYSSSFQLDDSWHGAFRAKQLRVEMKGNLGEHLSYRIRHRLNRSTVAMSEENFAKATDVMSVTWRFNDKFSIMGGKMCQFWGGFEFDENPMYIYEFSEMVNNMDNFLAGAALLWYPMPGHEFVLNITNSYSGRFADEYGWAPATVDGTLLQEATLPLSYILNWNGNMFGGLLETRWSVGLYNQAKGYQDYMAFLGQRLVLPRFQCYLDWMSAWEGLDRLRLATAEIGGAGFQTNVHYNSFVLKANWQFMPGWNLMVKGMYDTASAPGFDNYRQVTSGVCSLEYYPVQDQDFRVFLAYIGHNYNFDAAVGIPNAFTNRIELGFMYRIKAY